MMLLKAKTKKLDLRGPREATDACTLVSEGSMSSSAPSQLVEALEHVERSMQQQQGSRYLIISVVEARNLVAKDYDTHSSDPFVKISLGAVVRKTRAIYRNCHPLWEQKVVFPIDGLDAGVPLQVELFDKDFNSKEFLGQVMMTLGKALDIAADEVQRGSYWLVLSKKRSTDIVGGELCLGFETTLLDQQQYTQLTSELEAQLSSDTLAALYGSKALQITVKGFNGLAASGLFGSGGGQAEQLSLYIKFGRVLLEKPLTPLINPGTLTEDEPGASGSDAYEVCVNEEVVIPLAPAVRTPPLVVRKKDELYDIKLYLKSHDTLIAKTQIPITSVPFFSSPAGDDGASSTGRVTPEGHHKGLLCLMDGLDGADACLGSSSGPSTPRGTTAEFLPAGPLTPNSSPLCDPPASPMTRSKSEAFGLSALHKRLGGLGGWVGSSSNLSTVSTSSPSTTASTASPTMGQAAPRSENPFGHSMAKFAVEGSLDSVTACSRSHPVHSPAGLQGCRVQGLAELHEGGSRGGLREPLKAIFVPPREANRSGWVPVKVPEGGDDDPGSPSPRSRSFTRIMESTVPMHCHLEVSMGLALLEHKATLPFAAAAAAAGAAASELSGDSISDDEQDEAAQATPIQPGPALEVPLQDVTLTGIGVNRLYALVISANSDLMKAHNAAHGITEMSVGPWRAGAGCLRVRDVSYTKKLNIPLPLAPEKCHVWEEHRLIMKEPGGWVVLINCKNDAPKSDCFEAQVQMCGVYINGNTSKLRVSMQLNWLKNTWGKSMVQGGAETDAKRSYEALVKRLREQPGLISTGLDLQAAAQQAVAQAEPDSAPQASKRGWLRRGHFELLLQAALVLALLLVAYAVLSAGYSISAELRQVAAAVRKCNGAVEAPPGVLQAYGVL